MWPYIISNFQGQGYRVKKCWYPRRGIFFWNFKALLKHSLFKIICKFKVCKSKVKATRPQGKNINGGTLRNIKALICTFQIVRQTQRSRLQGKKCWYPRKGLVTRNNLLKFQSFIKTLTVQKLLARLKFKNKRFMGHTTPLWNSANQKSHLRKLKIWLIY